MSWFCVHFFNIAPHMIQEDYDRKKQQIHVDKKLMRNIMEKKEAHGQKM